MEDHASKNWLAVMGHGSHHFFAPPCIDHKTNQAYYDVIFLLLLINHDNNKLSWKLNTSYCIITVADFV